MKKLLLVLCAILCCFCVGCQKETRSEFEDVLETLESNNVITTLNYHNSYSYYKTNGKCFNVWENEEEFCENPNFDIEDVFSVSLDFMTDKYRYSDDDYYFSNNRCNVNAYFYDGIVDDVQISCEEAEYSFNNSSNKRELLDYTNKCIYSFYDISEEEQQWLHYPPCENTEVALGKYNNMTKMLEENGITEDQLVEYVQWFRDHYGQKLRKNIVSNSTKFSKLGITTYYQVNVDDINYRNVYYNLEGIPYDINGEKIDANKQEVTYDTPISTTMVINEKERFLLVPYVKKEYYIDDGEELDYDYVLYAMEYHNDDFSEVLVFRNDNYEGDFIYVKSAYCAFAFESWLPQDLAECYDPSGKEYERAEELYLKFDALLNKLHTDPQALVDYQKAFWYEAFRY